MKQRSPCNALDHLESSLVPKLLLYASQLWEEKNAHRYVDHTLKINFMIFHNYYVAVIFVLPVFITVVKNSSHTWNLFLS